jgi:hypothetical protein
MRQSDDHRREELLSETLMNTQLIENGTFPEVDEACECQE